MTRRVIASAYVLGVAALAIGGFATSSAEPIVLAAGLTLPVSVLAVPAFYVASGLLALLPGANPSSSTGSGICTPDGGCQLATTGDPASWWTYTTDVLGVSLLTSAAVLNVVLLGRLLATRHRGAPTAAR